MGIWVMGGEGGGKGEENGENENRFAVTEKSRTTRLLVAFRSSALDQQLVPESQRSTVDD